MLKKRIHHCRKKCSSAILILLLIIYFLAMYKLDFSNKNTIFAFIALLLQILYTIFVKNKSGDVFNKCFNFVIYLILISMIISPYLMMFTLSVITLSSPFVAVVILVPKIKLYQEFSSNKVYKWIFRDKIVEGLKILAITTLYVYIFHDNYSDINEEVKFIEILVVIIFIIILTFITYIFLCIFSGWKNVELDNCDFDISLNLYEPNYYKIYKSTEYTDFKDFMFISSSKYKFLSVLSSTLFNVEGHNTLDSQLLYSMPPINERSLHHSIYLACKMNDSSFTDIFYITCNFGKTQDGTVYIKKTKVYKLRLIMKAIKNIQLWFEKKILSDDEIEKDVYIPTVIRNNIYYDNIYNLTEKFKNRDHFKNTMYLNAHYGKGKTSFSIQLSTVSKLNVDVFSYYYSNIIDIISDILNLLLGKKSLGRFAVLSVFFIFITTIINTVFNGVNFVYVKLKLPPKIIENCH